MSRATLTPLSRLLLSIVMMACLVVACGDDNASPAQAPAAEADVEAMDAGADVLEMDTTAPDTRDPDTAQPEADSATVDATEGTAEPTPTFAAQGEWGPAGRVVAILTPDTPQVAREWGCQVFGYNVGSGISNLVLLAGGLNPYLQMDADGQIPLHLLMVAHSYEAGESVTDRDRVDIGVYYGVFDEQGRTRIRETSFEGDDPSQAARTWYPDTLVTESGWAETPPGSFRLTLPILFDLVVSLDLSLARLAGPIQVDGVGVGTDGALLTGYITYTGLVELLTTIKAQCLSDEPPLLCNLIGNGIDDPERPVDELIDLGTGLINGFDLHMTEEGFPYPCDPEGEGDACNAASVCIQLVAEGVVVEGVE